MHAQTTVTYTNGETDSAALSTTAPNNPTTLSIATGTATQSGLISGTGALDISGGGILILSNASNSYTGATTVSSATTLAISANGSIFDSSGLSLSASGATLDVSSTTNTDGVTVPTLSGVAGSVVQLGSEFLAAQMSGAATFAGVMEGTGSSEFTISGTGHLTLTGVNTYQGLTEISSGSTLSMGTGGSIADSSEVEILGTGTFALNSNQTIGDLFGASASTLALGTNTLTVVESNPTTYAGTITSTSSAGSLIKQGAATLLLTGTNTYIGTTTIANGTLEVVGGAISNSNAVSLTASGATLDNSSTTTAMTLTDLSGVAGSVVQLGSRALTVSMDKSTTFAGVMEGTSGSGSNFTVQGNGPDNGHLTITGVNTYPGATTIASGTILSIGAGGSIADSNFVTLNGTATLDISHGGNQTIGELAGSSGSTLSLGGNTLTEAVTLGASTYAGTITSTSSTGSLIKQGAGALDLSGDNLYQGATTINGGLLDIFGGNISNSSGVNLANSGTVFQIDDVNQTITNLTGVSGSTVDLSTANLTVGTATSTEFDGVIEGGGAEVGSDLTKQGTGTLTLTGSNTYTGGITITAGQLIVGNGGATGNLGSGGVTDNASLAYDLSGNLTESNTITGSGSLVQSGSGTLTLTGTNTYTGATTVSAGTLVVATGGTLGTGGTLTVNTGGTLSLGGNQTVGAVTLGGGTISGSATLTGTSYNSSGGGTISAILAGSGSFTNTSGTTTLSAANTYTGATTVSGGELIITGNLTSSSSFSVASGATLDLTGATVSTPGAITNNGTLILGAGVTLSSTGTFTNNGTLNLLNDPSFVLPANFVNTGTILTLSPTDTPLLPLWSWPLLIIGLFLAASTPLDRKKLSQIAAS